jgi:hypothetical protein
MRPFSKLAIEFIGMAAPTLRGVVTGDWSAGGKVEARTKADLLRLWDVATDVMNTLWPLIPRTGVRRSTRPSASGRGRYTGCSST